MSTNSLLRCFTSKVSNGVILVVEDDPGIAAFTVRLLQHEGFSCFSVPSVAAALRAAVARAPDMIVSDFNLDDGTAIDLLAGLEKKRVKVPVVVQSAAAPDELQELRAIPSVQHVLRKPVPPSELMKAIDNCMDLPRSTPNLAPRLVGISEHRALAGEPASPSPSAHFIEQHCVHA